jgi:hypothetical protein
MGTLCHQPKAIGLAISRWGAVLGLLGGLLGPANVRAASPDPFTAAPAAVQALASAPRQVNIPYFSGSVDGSQMAIFWFGINQNPPGQDRPNIAGQNYVDVRVAYSPAGLAIKATVVDYWVWYGNGAQPTQDDAIAFYLDTHNDRASAPQSDDYLFIYGANRSPNDTSPYRHLAQGNGSGWQALTTGAFTGTGDVQWDTGGPNDNSNGFEYGWVASLVIPWSQLGLSGPPANGARWGLGAINYDRDGSGAAATPVVWPEAFATSQPATWGVLNFGLADYHPPTAVARGTTMIRGATPTTTNNTVQDAWVGGDSACTGGHMGESTFNHGTDTSVYVGSEVAPTHFPCYNKSYLRFALDAVPADKVIISATLSLQYTGSDGDQNAAADEDKGHNSYLWAYTIADTWDELTTNWNNAPLAQENIDRVLVPPLVVDSLPWANKPHFLWNVTQAVAQAYAAGQPVNLALYDSADARNTTKHFTSTQTGINDPPTNNQWNWNIAGRPRLDVVWGDSGNASPTITKRASSSAPAGGSTITYSLTCAGMGKTLWLTDTVPAELTYIVGSLTSTSGTPTYASGQITWSGAPATGSTVTITYRARVDTTGPKAVFNTVQVGASGSSVASSTAIIIVDGLRYFLPFVTR